MKNTKFVKGYCAEKNRYFGLEVQQIGGEYKVVDFTDLPREQAKLLTTEVDQERFVSADNLQPCRQCRSRTVGGCNHARGKGGCLNGKYNFQCLYCNGMKIDRSEAEISGQYKEGDVIRLSQGQEVRITGGGGKPLTRIELGAGWDPTRGGSNMDVDCSVAMCSGHDMEELIYFGHRDSEDGSIVHHGDNLTGIDSDTEGQDDENISVDLTRVSSSIDKLVFFFNIFSGKSRGQDLSDLENMYLRILDPVSRKSLIEYRVSGNYRRAHGIIVASVKRSGSGWTFKAQGIASDSDDCDVTAEEGARLD